LDKLNRKEDSVVSLKKRIWIALAAGLYPFLHFYSNNYNIANSWEQFVFLFSLCILVPLGIVFILPHLFRLRWLKKLRAYYLTAFNFLYFTGLLGLLIFHFRKGIFILILSGVGLLSLVLYRHLTKIIILQFLLAIMSLFTMVPRLYFVYSYDDSWTKIEPPISAIKFKQTPNIYFIQPDGYVNFSEIRKLPYDHLDMGFENWLTEKGFINYGNFRSNYFTTLTSNSSVFTMKHHYYQNINKSTAKTHRAMEDIVGDNNALRILNNNYYRTHLFTNNTFFLLNRKLKAYDFCNIPQSMIPFYKLGRLNNIDIISDLEATLKTQSDAPNFYFIENTIPGHVRNTERASRGVEKEREKYLESVERANDWLTSLISLIDEHDKNPLIVIMADHGGSVGLAYSSEIKERKLNASEISSVFSALMSIRWPNNEDPQNLNFKSSVNLFRNLFYYLSEDPILLKSYQTDKSFIYIMENNFVEVYECLDENGNFGYKKIE